MPVFESPQKLKNGRIYETTSDVSETNSSGTKIIMSVHEINAENESEARTLTQEGVVEQIKNYIAPLTEQQKGLTWLTQRICTAHRSNTSPRTSNSSNVSAAGAFSDKYGHSQSQKTIIGG